MTSTAPDQAPQGGQDDRALVSSGAKLDRAEREHQNGKRAKSRKQDSLGDFFTPAVILGAFFLLHDMDIHNTGKGPNRVIDHGHYISIPRNANQDHMRQAAQLAMNKGWTTINVHSSLGAKHPAVGALEQMAPQLAVNGKPRIGSFYADSVNTIVGHHFAKVAARAQSFAASYPQPA